MTLLGHSVGNTQFQQRFGTKKALVLWGREKLYQNLADNLMALGCLLCRKNRKAKRMHGDGQLFY